MRFGKHFGPDSIKMLQAINTEDGSSKEDLAHSYINRAPQPIMTKHRLGSRLIYFVHFNLSKETREKLNDLKICVESQKVTSDDRRFRLFVNKALSNLSGIHW